MERGLIINALKGVFVLVVFQWEFAGTTPAEGFRIYIGDSSGNYNQVVDIEDPEQRSAQVEIPEWTGSKFAAISAYNVWGESAKGQELQFGEKPNSPLDLKASPAQQ